MRMIKGWEPVVVSILVFATVSKGQEEYFVPIREGYTGIINKLLGAGVSLGRTKGAIGFNNEVRLGHGVTPLHAAIICQNKEIADLLLKNGADINATARYDSFRNAGVAPLHLAVICGLTNMIEYLVDKGADLEKETTDGYHAEGYTPLMINYAGIRPVKRIGAGAFMADYPSLAKVEQLLIRKGAKITVFSAACMTNATALSTILKSDPMQARALNSAGKSALHFAAALHRPEAVRLLIEYGADVNLRASEGETPLLATVLYMNASLRPSIIKQSQPNDSDKCLEVVRLLVENKADMDVQFTNKYTGIRCSVLGIADRYDNALEERMMYREIEITKVLDDITDYLLDHGASIKLSGSHMLCLAVMRSQLERVQKLIDRGEDVNRSNGYFTPLHLAVKEGSKPVIKLLLDKGANPNEKDHQGRTVLAYAREIKAEVPLYEFMKEKGITIDEKVSISVEHISTMMQTIRHNAPNKVTEDELIAELNRDPEIFKARDRDGNTVLHLAARCDVVKVCKFILENDVNPNVQNNKGKTPLHEALWTSGRIDTYSVLLMNGADVNAKDNEGKTPLHTFIEKGLSAAKNNLNWANNARISGTLNESQFKEYCDHLVDNHDGNRSQNTIRFLISKGAIVPSQDSQGRSLQEMAASLGLTNLVQVLKGVVE